MTHFAVLVVTDEEPTGEVLQRVLLPWHESEMTGYEDYVVFIDQHDEIIEGWKRDTVTRYHKDGGPLLTGYEDEFYRDHVVEPGKRIPAGAVFRVSETGTPRQTAFMALLHRLRGKPAEARAGRVKVPVDPETLGYRKRVIPVCEYYADIETFALKHLGCEIENGRFGRRTNPNAKWDGWMLGGRWKGLLLARPGAAALTGEPGIMKTVHSQHGVDAVRRRDLDLERMRRRACDDRAQQWAECLRLARAIDPGVRDDDLERIRARYARKRDEQLFAWAMADPHPDRRRHYETFMGDLFRYEPVFNLLYDPAYDELIGEQFAARVYLGERPIRGWIERARPLTTYALIKDGIWYQRPETDRNDSDGPWERQFDQLMAQIRPDQWLAIVDCHI